MILVVTDCYSRWVEAYPLGKATTKSIVDTFERELFRGFGYPRALLSDNGPQFVSKAMGEALKKWEVEGWTTPIYHSGSIPVERQNQELKKGLRTLLVDKPHHLWDVYLPHVLFSVRNRENRNTGQSPAKFMFGREIKAPGDWQLELAEGSPDASKNGPELSGAVRNPPVEIDDSPVELDDAPVVEGGDPVVSVPKAPSTHITPESPGRSNLSVGDRVYYNAHPQSSAEKRFHAGFAPKWLSPVKLGKPLGTGVFLTESKHPTKLHVSAMKRAVGLVREH
ncbi:uncharacterized protein LOC107883654 [Acyrthosiphon pisum]|uniref:Integrase catalytic domain-containing protein n=1 Tax=Acyrthosiphon pisum TaxID=7029 RepID=A0A8R2H7M6_ACYPI|nr:uncharacterized protein LOC107883654 [Acyrthosiphon pisum]|eukprot:XP_016659604.1 PREDICTED: uncharacterized protein LOC107883654 [Acyrthosiphon pisum]